jgi:hypothetical protein
VLNTEISFWILRSSAQKLPDALYTIPVLLYLYSSLTFISYRSSISSVPRKEVECSRILRVFGDVINNGMHSFTDLVDGPIEQYNSDVHVHTSVLTCSIPSSQRWVGLWYYNAPIDCMTCRLQIVLILPLGGSANNSRSVFIFIKNEQKGFLKPQLCIFFFSIFDVTVTVTGFRVCRHPCRST